MAQLVVPKSGKKEELVVANFSTSALLFGPTSKSLPNMWGRSVLI